MAQKKGEFSVTKDGEALSCPDLTPGAAAILAQYSLLYLRIKNRLENGGQG